MTALLARLGGPAALPLAKATSRGILDALIALARGTDRDLRAAPSGRGGAEGPRRRRPRPRRPSHRRASARAGGQPRGPEPLRRRARGQPRPGERRSRRASPPRRAGSRRSSARTPARRPCSRSAWAKRDRSSRGFRAPGSGGSPTSTGASDGRPRESARRTLGRPASDWAGPDAGADAARRAAPMRDESRYDVVWLGRGAEASLPERSRAILEAYAKAGHRVFPSSSGGCRRPRRASPRTEALAATAVFVEDPAGLPHAKRMRASRAAGSSSTRPASPTTRPSRRTSSSIPRPRPRTCSTRSRASSRRSRSSSSRRTTGT